MARKPKDRPTSRPTTDDDAYKRLFAEPRIVRDLLRRFVTPGWTARLDFRTLQALPTEQVGDNLKARRKDIVWRVRLHADRASGIPGSDGADASGGPGPAAAGVWLYLVVMIEFQSRDDSFMALRMNEYCAMLYRHLSRSPEQARTGQVPPILPLVLYNGESEWKAADSVLALIPPVPESHLQSFLPTHRAYLLLDEVRLARHLGPTPSDNVAELFMRFEASPDAETGQRLIRHLKTLLASPAAESLRLAFTAWLNHTVVRRFQRSHNLPERDLPWLELDDMPTVLENNIRRSNKEREQKAAANSRVQMLTRQLTIRFGELSTGTVEHIRGGTEADHDRWAERLLTASSLEAVFEPLAS